MTRMNEIATALQSHGYRASVQELRPNILPPFIEIECPKGNPFALTVTEKGFKLLARDEAQTLVLETVTKNAKAVTLQVIACTESVEWLDA